MKTRRRVVFGALGVLGGLVSAGLLWVTQAGADGIPAANPLSYSGTLEDVDGSPLGGSKDIRITIFDAVSGGTSQCTVTQTVALSNGRFQIPLPDTCTAAVRANPNLWIDVAVDGESLGRTKLAAVPYAVEATRASSATGTLGTQIVPSGAVMAFDLAACPAGWAPLATARGRVVVGATTGLALGATPGADSVTLTTAQMPAHDHKAKDNGHVHVVGNTINYFISPTFGPGNQGVGQAAINSEVGYADVVVEPTGGGQAFDNRQASLALLYCKKN